MTDSLLGADERQDLSCRIQLNTEASLIPISNGLPKFRQSVGFRIAMVCRVMRGHAYTFNNMRRRRQVRVTNAEIDYVFPLGPKFSYLPVYFHEKIRRQSAKSIG
jgi:hypothetical protein